MAAAACPLRAAFDGEDGEALNGEPEIDLTSKVGPAGGRAAASAITPPGPRRSPPCRSAVRGGAAPEPDRSPAPLAGEREAGARLPPPGREAPLGARPAPASPGRAAGPEVPCGGGRERRSKVVPYPGRDWTGLAGCSALRLPRLGCSGGTPARSRCSSLRKRRVWSCQLLQRPADVCSPRWVSVVISAASCSSSWDFLHNLKRRSELVTFERKSPATRML